MPRMASVRAVIDELLQLSQPITTKTVATRAGVSRQAAQKQLKALVEDGALTVEGKARAARYHPKKDDAKRLWAKVEALAQALTGIDNLPPVGLTIPQARMSRAQTVEVASAGSLFRLSARLLLQDVDCDELTLDFRGVEDLGDEFVEEVFERWAKQHPLTKLRIVNLLPALEPRVNAK
jgi:hypothetical protein